MSGEKSVCIIGGGIAGLSSAVFLADKGFKVTLIEASPKLGGRAYSFLDREKNLFFDNGQHILAGWYKTTFEYLKLTGSYKKLNFQKALEINFINGSGGVHRFKCPKLPAPLDLLAGLKRFDAFDKTDRKSLRNIIKLLFLTESGAMKYSNTMELLDHYNQTENVKKYFWEPLILAVFNTGAGNVSAEIFLKIIKTGFLKPGNSKLVIPGVNMNELLVDDAVIFLKKKNADIRTGIKAEKIVTGNNLVKEILLEDGCRIYSDYYISAVPFFNFTKLFDDKNIESLGIKAEKLRSSSIVSVHLFFENNITEDILQDNSFGMTGLINTKVQWIFKRGDKHLSLVISGADDLGIKEMTGSEITDLAMKELNKCITGFDKLILKESKVIKEKRATFIPDTESKHYRPDHKTKLKNFFIAGDWTDTGLPATIEGAVRSSKTISEIIKLKTS